MVPVGKVIFLTIVIFIGLGIVIRFLANIGNSDKKLSESDRQRLFDLFKSKFNSILQAVKEFNERRNPENGYLTNYQATTWKSQYESLYYEIRNKSFENILLRSEEVKIIRGFLEIYSSTEKFRQYINDVFIQDELKKYSHFFENIDGRKLDFQQRKAIVTDEDNNLVIAGAGSGKTTTIVGKIGYVLDRYKTKPREILLISFTNKSAEDLKKRINIKGLEAKTFHKFGKEVIVNVEKEAPSVFGNSKDDENRTSELKELIKTIFQEQIEDETYLRKITKYFSSYMKPVKLQFKNQSEYIQYLKDHNFKPYKKIKKIVKGKLTYNREIVKSIEECKIANFLLFNGVDYEYELPYERNTATKTHGQYKPDFTVVQNGKKVYIEHFGISRNGDVPQWFTGSSELSAKQKYKEGMDWKRNLHKRYGTTLIETYSYEMSEEILYKNLTKKLKEAGIIQKLKSPNEIWKIISDAAQDEVDSFEKLLATFITLMKSNNYSLSDVSNKNNRINDKLLAERNTKFIEIVKPIYESYEKKLLDKGEIDFSDMINKASNYIASRKYKKKFSYVIIDEFQDISIGRYELVKAIKKANPACKLFCVGDDWQSIYRFTGSDIALFKEFEKYFGCTEKSKIESTYRFYNPLIKLSSDFIQKNPNQVRKELHSISEAKTTTYKIKYSTSDSHQDDTICLKEIFDELIEEDVGIKNKSIFILSRYNRDIKRIQNEENIFNIDKRNGSIIYESSFAKEQRIQITAQFITIHKAKGLEADIVIILNCNSGSYGLPSEMSDDPVLHLLLSEADQYENGEERRVFYVAMTRAKEKIYFIADSGTKSKFIRELEIESGQSPNKCPSCKTGDIVYREIYESDNGVKYKYYGCTNYLYGCEFNKKERVI